MTNCEGSPQCWSERLDETVLEIFSTMLSENCVPVGATTGPENGLSAAIEIFGSYQAQCVVQFPTPSARELARAFLGTGEMDTDESILGDSVGELCNLIAGGWKRRIGDHAWGAGLSTPSIFSTAESVGPPAGATTLHRAYSFSGSTFTVRLAAFAAAESSRPAA